MGSLSLISLNIERSKHLDRILPFLREQEPDVFCVQELSESDYTLFQEMFRYAAPFVPLSMYTEEGQRIPQGICIFSNVPLLKTQVHYYVGDPSSLTEIVLGQPETYTKGNRALLFATVEKEGVPYRIATTHFTWSEKGEASDTQREHLQSLLSALDPEKELVLCGDFNMPRGGELFSTLSDSYKDNIPPEYMTSIDVSLHRNRLEDPEELSQKMVDGLFTTPEYLAHTVRLVSGVSDHMAIVATVEIAI
jgi:endonuclease/exonuclease/phosphatase family metal-dependent hydrolase